MLLVDTSVWVDYLRGRDSIASAALREAITGGQALATTEPVVMELLAGAADDVALARLERLTSGLTMLSVQPALDFAAAATLYRAAHRRGVTVRRLIDCLIAAIALRHGVALLHKDIDFDAIAAFTDLEVVSAR